MSRKKNNTRRQKTKREKASFAQRMLGSFLLVLIVIIIGLIIFNFFRSSPTLHHQQSTPSQSLQKTTRITQAQEQNKPAEPVTSQVQIHQPKYSFYDDLRKRSDEVNIELKEKIKAADEIKVDGKNYRIQIGAFRERDRADRLRAKMILRDYPVQIINNGDWFLVQIGPYVERERALKIQRKLQRQGIKDSVLKAYLN